jgi:indole-3-glycerol phosphate synthase
MILDDIVKDKRKRLIEQKKEISFEEMKKKALNTKYSPKDFYNVLSKEGLSIIGEFKQASPSMGTITQKIDLSHRIEQYNASVDAISVLTEEDHFNGSIEYLKKIRSISKLPIIRKDFIIDEYQIYEAKVINADCILLIVAILTDEELKKLYTLAYSLGLDVLVETHSEEEMSRALKLGAKIIGINNRDLTDFTIKLSTTKRLSAYMKESLCQMKMSEKPILVSESGVANTDDVRFLKECNVDALLIGRTFMEAENPCGLSNSFKEAFNGN